MLSDFSLFLCVTQGGIPERGKFLSGDVDGEFVYGALSSGQAKMLGFRFICETFDRCIGQGDGVFRWNQASGDAVQHDF